MNLKLKEKNSSIKSRKLLKMNLFLISGAVLNFQIFTGSSCKGNKNNDPNKTYLPKTKTRLHHDSEERDKITKAYEKRLSELEEKKQKSKRKYEERMKKIEEEANERDIKEKEEFEKKFKEQNKAHEEEMKEINTQKEKDNEYFKNELSELEIKSNIKRLTNVINDLLKNLKIVKLPSDDTECDNYINYLIDLIKDEKELRKIVIEGVEKSKLNEINKFKNDRLVKMNTKKNELVKEAKKLKERNRILACKNLMIKYERGNIIYDCTSAGYTWTNEKINEVEEAIKEELPKLEQAEREERYRKIRDSVIPYYKREYQDIEDYPEKKYEILFKEVEKKLDDQYKDLNNDLRIFESREIEELRNKLDVLSVEYNNKLTEKTDDHRKEIVKIFENIKDENDKSELMKMKIYYTNESKCVTVSDFIKDEKIIFENFAQLDSAKKTIETIYEYCKIKNIQVKK